jgi:hypothetical protein
VTPERRNIMERLWLANIESGTTDDELRSLFRKYAPDLECTGIQRAEGSGSRPAAMVTFAAKRFDTLGKLRLRLDGMYWKGRKLACSTTIL